MKQSPELNKIQENMKPGHITLQGFLGPDTRNLVDILNEDNQTVKESGMDHIRIAEKMQYFREKGSEGLGEFVSVPPHFEVRVDSARGSLPSPFGGPGLFSKTNTCVKNKKLDREITYSDLSIHLIREHGFYQGRGSLYRLDPQSIITVLEIT